MSRDQILQRLKKLYNHIESAQKLGNQAEAEAFAAKAQELLDKHELTMTDVEYARLQEEDPMRKRDVVGKKKARSAWKEQLAYHVATAHHCRFIVNPGSDSLIFVGRGTHTEVCAYVFQQLAEFAETQSTKDYEKFYWRVVGEDGNARRAKGYRAGWLVGFTNGIWRRYKQQRDEMEAAMRASGQGVALIRLENADKAVLKYMKESMRLSSAGGVHGRYSGNAEGRGHGNAAAAKANISGNGLRTGGSVKGYLT